MREDPVPSLAPAPPSFQPPFLTPSQLPPQSESRSRRRNLELAEAAQLRLTRKYGSERDGAP